MIYMNGKKYQFHKGHPLVDKFTLRYYIYYVIHIYYMCVYVYVNHKTIRTIYNIILFFVKELNHGLTLGVYVFHRES